ncbi:MAG: zinc-binding dehydrogenase [Nitrospirae bacterium]|nr:zinc-binding dehydrogenase [Nitrospirota bacterium]
MKYKRIVITRSGGPEVLQVVEEELPEPRTGEVRVKVLTAGVAFTDILVREGLFPGMPAKPFTPGFDMVGIVDKHGAGITAPGIGETVATLRRSGCYAGYVCVPASELVIVPVNLDPAEAVCLCLTYVTAYQLLHRAARVKQGERILYHGAGGAVGTALLQLGRLSGLEMYGTASKGKHDLVASLGGVPIDYKNEDFAERIRNLTGDGVDAVFDPIGGTHWLQSYKTLRKGGRLVPFGISSILKDGKMEVAIGFLILILLKLIPDRKKVLWLFGIGMWPYSSRELCRQDLKMLLDLLVQKQISPVVAARLPLVEAARAHELISNASISGKIVLVCNR